MTEVATTPYLVSVKVPFPSKRHAEIAFDTLRIDAEPARSFITKKYSLEENLLKVEFSGDLAKNVRVGLTAFFESLILCCETLKEFGPPSESYDHY